MPTKCIVARELRLRHLTFAAICLPLLAYGCSDGPTGGLADTAGAAAGQAGSSAVGGMGGAGGGAPAMGGSGVGGESMGLAGMGPASAGQGFGGPAAKGEVCDAYTQVFLKSCSGSVCHDNPIFPAPFAVDAQAASAFVGLPSEDKRFREACGLVIDPANPGESLILRKVNGTLPTDRSCGAPMPLNGDAFPPEQLACLESWLTQFAR